MPSHVKCVKKHISRYIHLLGSFIKLRYSEKWLKISPLYGVAILYEIHDIIWWIAPLSSLTYSIHLISLRLMSFHFFLLSFFLYLRKILYSFYNTYRSYICIIYLHLPIFFFFFSFSPNIHTPTHGYYSYFFYEIKNNIKHIFMISISYD